MSQLTEKTDNSNGVSRLTSLIPLAFPLLIFLGVSRLYFYYITFHINIISFLDFGEIITSFLDITIISLFLLSIMFGTLVISSFLIVKGSSKKKNFYNLWIILASSVIVPYILLKIDSSGTAITLVFIFFFLFSFLFVRIYTLKDDDERLTSVSKPMLLIVTYIWLGLLFLFFTSKNDANSVIKSKKYFGVVISYKDTTTNPLISDSNNYFIGKTSNYIFIYNQKTDRTKAQKMESVESIEFPKPGIK